MLNIMIISIVCMGLCVGLDKFDKYGKENDLYVSGYLSED